MDKFQKVPSQRSKGAPINENEIRITSQGLLKNYISYASTLLHERKNKDIVLKAMGMAISKAVAIAEIMKRRLPRLHQDTAISSVSITDVYEPIEEGLEPVEQTRHVSMISITLSPDVLDKNSPGYQGPPAVAQPRPQYTNYQQQQRPPGQGRVIYHAQNEDSYGRGRGRERGRGWSRGGGHGNYQDNGGYSNGNQGGRRGQNWEYRDYGYEEGNGYDRGNGYDGGYRGNGYDRGNGYNGGYNRGNGYHRDDGYYNGGGYERGNGYNRGGGVNQRGPRNNERGGVYEQQQQQQQRGRGGGGGRRGGYGRGPGRMGGRGRNDGY